MFTILRNDLFRQVGLLNLKTNVVRAGIEGAQLVNSCKLQSVLIVLLSRANMHFEVIFHAAIVIVTIIIFTTIAVLGGEEEEEEEEKPSSYRRYPSYRRSYYQRPRYYSNGYYRG